ncbi:cytochrome c550 [Radiobacillus sp. PE A8.2]|uniref:cytochrome c550 n=1 Tax=Radiobacillus sp. PE A8.2 TaxID=3380349 RepID=UPI00388FC613
MKKNPVIPYALIAVLGILTIIVLSMVGLNQQEKIEMAGEGGGESQEVNTDPEQISQNCTVCHGADLAGGTGPNLQNIGSKYDADQILNIIQNGIEGTSMPPGVVKGEEAEVLAEWLAEKK